LDSDRPDRHWRRLAYTGACYLFGLILTPAYGQYRKFRTGRRGWRRGRHDGRRAFARGRLGFPGGDRSGDLGGALVAPSIPKGSLSLVVSACVAFAGISSLRTPAGKNDSKLAPDTLGGLGAVT
jgi:hypothetical protein